MADRPPPDFVIGGANKAGTTSLWEYMNTHPQICMAWLKEPRYFMRGHERSASGKAFDLPGNYDRGAEWYASLFASCRSGAVRGEGTAMYLRSSDAPGLVRNDAPHARIIFVLRDPVSRLHSQYHHERRFFRHPPFEDIVKHNHPLLERYLDGSRYAHHLARWYEHFPSEQVLVLLTEDLFADARSTVAKAFAFVEVDPTFVPPNIDRRYNEAYVGRIPVLNRLVRNRLQALPGSVARALRAVGDPLRRLNQRSLEVTALDPTVRAGLVELLSNDIDRLQRMIGRDLASWRTADRAQR